MKKTTFCIANWKMNMNSIEAKHYFKMLRLNVSSDDDVNVIICPSYTMLNTFFDIKDMNNVYLGAQNISSYNKGAYTGEVAGYMLKDIGCEWVIIGHSERREILFESNDIIEQKFSQCLESNINPIICIGETQKEREVGATYDVLKKQLTSIFSSKNTYEELNLIIAYEPIWAIGTGLFANNKIIFETNCIINEIMGGINPSINFSLVYGGSVSPNNAQDLLEITNLDGFLIGGASLIVEDFVKIYKNCKERYL